LELNPDHLAGLYNLANLNFRINDFTEAAALFQRLVDDWINLGMTLKVLGTFDAAEAAYRRALALDPGHVEAH